MRIFVILTFCISGPTNLLMQPPVLKEDRVFFKKKTNLAFNFWALNMDRKKCTKKPNSVILSADIVIERHGNSQKIQIV